MSIENIFSVVDLVCENVCNLVLYQFVCCLGGNGDVWLNVNEFLIVVEFQFI